MLWEKRMVLRTVATLHWREFERKWTTEQDEELLAWGLMYGDPVRGRI